MAWVEDTGKRTRNAKHFYDSTTGKWRAEFTIHHRHYHDGSAWQDLGESIVDDGADGFDKKCDKTRHIFRVKSGGNYRWYPRRDVPGEYVEITEIQYYTNRWRTLNLPAAVWKQQSAEWDMTNLYASITNTWHQVKTDFILKNSSAYTRLRFAITFVGLTYNDSTGTLTSTTDGLVWGHIPKPTAHDANEEEVTVTQTYDGTYLEWNVVTTGATYPIYVDPTFTDGYGGDVQTYIDTRLTSTAADTNYATGTTIRIHSSANVGLYKFDISSIADGVTVDSAYLYLTNEDQNAAGKTLYIRTIKSANSTWTEADATWNYAVASTTRWAGDTGSDGGADAGCSVSGTDYDATEIGTITYVADTAAYTEHQSTSLNATAIGNWIAGTNYGIRINGSSDTNIDWYSSDHATTGYRPKLVVVYEAGVAVSLDTAGLTGTGIPLTVTASVSVSLSTASLTATGVPTTVIPSVSVSLSTAALTATGIGLDVVPGEKTITLSTASSTATGIPLTVAAGATVSLSTASLTVTPIPLTVSAEGGAQSISLDTASITATSVSLDVVPGAASITLSTASITATGIGAAVSVGGAPQSVSLDTASIAATGIPFQINQTVVMDTAAVTAAGVALSIFLGTLYISMDTAILTATGISVTVEGGEPIAIPHWRPKPNRTGYDRHLDRVANYYDTLRGKRK